MRIIAGEFRGRRLKSPDNYDIRPTSDKVKEAVFSMIAPQINQGCVASSRTSTAAAPSLPAAAAWASKL